MLIAVIGDTHLGRSLYNYNTTPSTRAVMYEFFRQCKAHRVDAAVHLGDVGDRPVWDATQQKLVMQWCNEFDRAGISLFILVGNHDVSGKRGTVSALDYLRATRFQHVRIIDRPMVLRQGDTELVLLPFPAPAHFHDAEQWIADVAALRTVTQAPTAFCHLNVDGAKMGEQEWMYRGGDYDLPASIKAGLIINGHIHTPQRIGKVLMPGAANRLRFSEAGDARHMFLISAHARRRCIKLRALEMSQITIDASAWASGGYAPSTEEALASIAEQDVAGKLVKVQPMVDGASVVSWSAVQESLYKSGAEHVCIAPPVHVKQAEKREQRSEKRESPTTLARRFVRERVSDQEEQRRVLAVFKQTQEQVDGG